MQWKYPEKWESGDWFLHHDYVPRHTALMSILQFSARTKIPVVLHSPYSPDLTPCDCFCFINWKSNWKGGIFVILSKYNENCRQSLTTVHMKILNSVSKSGRGASSHGEYFKGKWTFRLVSSLKINVYKQFWKLLGHTVNSFIVNTRVRCIIYILTYISKTLMFLNLIGIRSVK